MRLIDVATMQVSEFYGDAIPPYAILSHRWSNEEVDFKAFSKSRFRDSVGYRKVQSFCRVVEQYGGDMRYAWVDSCCIDGRSSAELSEAINSMFKWYQRAAVACVHLATVDLSKSSDTCIEQFYTSEWFKRGWTLQELLAPRYVLFFDTNWTMIGSLSKMVPRSLSGANKFGAIISDDLAGAQLIREEGIESWKRSELGTSKSLWDDVAECTSIRIEVLQGQQDLHGVSIAEKMSWLADRITTREEDMSYCMLGILGVQLPLLYGEGPNAFIRLQEELIRSTNDESLFSWPASAGEPWILASGPSSFATCRQIRSLRVFPRSPYTITNQGLELRLRRHSAIVCLRADGDVSVKTITVPLNCKPRHLTEDLAYTFMIRLEAQACGHYNRLWTDRAEARHHHCPNCTLLDKDETIYVHASMNSYEACSRAVAEMTPQSNHISTCIWRHDPQYSLSQVI